jgi:eukaryotic-like serine/threonine-protein kinase
MESSRMVDSQAANTNVEKQLVERWRQLQAAWRQALKDGLPLNLDAFLEEGLESERDILHQELGRIAEEDRQQRGSAAPEATLSFVQPPPGPPEASPANAASPPLVPVQSFEPQEHVPESATPPFVAATGGVTQEHIEETPAGATVSVVRPDPRVSASDTPSSSTGATQTTVAPTLGVVAGYECLEVLGRGGMGVVYKARQPGLKRVVALKVILAGEHADARDLARFRTEAQSVAQLQHSNIVQVYEVGDQNGCPHLSMEYIDGGSLKEKLVGKPQPIRHAAQLVQLLAGAMDFAHKKGIIHRDLKPANIMLMKPRPGSSTRSAHSTAPLVEELYGTPKIADFGLAKRLEEDSGQTRSGTILGTPNYMSPEQAGGQVKDVGPLSDQYALGAVLYELLTGRPPFQGTTMWETINQVRTREPVPPSQLQPKVPRDLETICLKCLQKEPHKRYADAAALAEDLRRFVSGEPIVARPISAPERFWRWCRRNPRVAILSGFVLASLLAIIAGLWFFNVKLTDEKAETEKQKVAALSARDDAKKNAKIADENAKVALEQRGLALKALGDFVTNVQVELGKKAGTQDLQKKLLEVAMGHLHRVSDNAAARISLKDSTLAAAHLNLGRLFLKLGESELAAEEFRRAEATYAAMVAADPDNPKARGLQAVTLMELGAVSVRLKGQSAAARAYYLKASDLLSTLEQGRPEDKITPEGVKTLRADVLDRLGWVTIDTNPEEARGYYQQSLDLRSEVVELTKNDQSRRALVGSYLLVGGADFRLRKNTSTEKYYQEAVRLREELAKKHTKDAGMQRDLAYARQRLGDFYLRTKQTKLATEQYETAVLLYQALVDEDPKRADFQDDLSRALYDVALAALQRGDKDVAAEKFQSSLAIRETRAKGRDDSVVQTGLMWTLAHCGQHVRAAEIAERLRKQAPDDRGRLFDVACCYALCRGAVAPEKSANDLIPDEVRLRDEYAKRALDTLSQAVAHGFRDAVGIETEPDLDTVRELSGFKTLLAELSRPTK